MMRIGSLFSGVGGLELGLEAAGVGHTVWQVEADEYRRAVLARHWPSAERYPDVRYGDSANLAPVDLICGGFPCQDVSSAGKRAGLGGARSGLWYEYLRIVSELRPEWVVVENVASGAAAWVDAVLAGLGEQGYACLPIPIAAADVGAPHERARIFVVATATSDVDAVLVRDEPRGRARSHGQAARVVTDHGTQRYVVPDARGAQTAKRTMAERGGWRDAMPPVVRVADGLSRGLDSPSKRRAALGDAVVPQYAEVIGWVIRELLDG